MPQDGAMPTEEATKTNPVKSAFEKDEKLLYRETLTTTWKEGVFVEKDGSKHIIIKPIDMAENVRIELFQGLVKKKIVIED